MERELECEINPQAFEAEYLNGLNTCFSGWGGEKLFRWCFQRTVGGPRGDLMVLRKQGTVLAGSAVTYRRVILENGQRILVGIMTGSWTLPAARGQGCFTRIIQESVALTASHGGALLLAFVTADNASFRRLRDAGSALIPSFYLFSSESGESADASILPLRIVEANVELVSKVCQKRIEAGTTSVVYTPPEWQSQFMDRSGHSELLEIGELGWVATERVGDFLRIQATCLATPDFEAVIASLVAHAQARSVRLFLVSMNDGLTAACTKLGMRASPGYLTLVAADSAALAQAVGCDTAWPGDSRLLADSDSAWNLGPIRFESGDRM